MVVALGIFLLVAFPIIFVLWFDRHQYMKSTYYKETGNRYRQARVDKGLNGEYLTSKTLDKLGGYHKSILNCYLPNGRGKTTEIDLVFIHETGLYVLESKNYSGWIFGNEEDKNWMQTFPNGKKQSFYNPIKQNRTHIKALYSVLDSMEHSPIKSLIIFSERCELKKVSSSSKDVEVIKRNGLGKLMKHFIKNGEKVFTAKEIDSIYEQLKIYSNVDEETKQSHIEQISHYQK